MAQTATIARPYAKAVFAIAQGARDYDGWQRQLELLAGFARDPQLRAAAANPKHSGAELASVIVDSAGDKLTAAGRNLVALLAERKRLAALPDILEQFAALRRDAEKVVEVELVTAVPADSAVQQRFAKALEAKLGRSVTLHNSTDAALIGGALVKAGDMVIDGSVRGRLAALAIDLAK
jgi:F-type H+-transporting ATPase subunit delta